MDSNYKAEDLLSGQVPKGKEDMVSENEQQLASEIKSAIKSSGNEVLTSLEKTELWSLIQEKSMSQEVKKTNWKLYLQIAAVLIMVTGLCIWQYQRNTTTNKLLDFAAQNINKKIITERKNRVSSSTSNVSSDEENIITTNDFNTLVVGDGQRSVIVLPDSTKVWLNSGAKLIFPVVFSKSTREVYLEGEAYFDVSHNKEKPFIVRAKDMNIKVLGTEFYVRADAVHKKNYAVLVNGSINFSSGKWLDKVERTLVPGEKIDYNPENNQMEVSKVPTAEVQSWKEGYLDIESESLDVIVQRIATYYNMQIGIIGLDLSNEKFTGKLVFQRSVQDVLDLLCNGTPYSYNSEERRIEFRKR